MCLLLFQLSLVSLRTALLPRQLRFELRHFLRLLSVLSRLELDELALLGLLLGRLQKGHIVWLLNLPYVSSARSLRGGLLHLVDVSEVVVLGQRVLLDGLFVGCLPLDQDLSQRPVCGGPGFLDQVSDDQRRLGQLSDFQVELAHEVVFFFLQFFDFLLAGLQDQLVLFVLHIQSLGSNFDLSLEGVNLLNQVRVLRF